MRSTQAPGEVAILELPGGGGPAPDRAILRALHQIERGLCVGFSPFRLDWTRDPPRVLLHRRTRRPFAYPRWYVCLRTGDGSMHRLFAVESPEGDFWPLDARVPQRILGDLGRRMSPDQIVDLIERARVEHETGKRIKLEDLRSQELKANKRKIAEVFEGDNLNLPAEASTLRDQKIISYPGQTNHTVGRESVKMTPAERGWEKPDYEKEMS